MMLARTHYQQTDRRSLQPDLLMGYVDAGTAAGDRALELTHPFPVRLVPALLLDG